MKKVISISVAAVALATLSACNSSSDEALVIPPPPPTSLFPPFDLRVVHAASDAPAVNVRLNGNVVISDLEYGQSSSNFSLERGSYNIAVDAQLPGATTATVIGPVDLSFDAATKYKIFAVGSVAADTLQPLIVTSEVKSLASDNVRLQVVHAASAAPTVDIHVTAPDAPLSAALATLDFRGSTAALDVPAGDYRVRITLPGQSTVVFDSGALPLAGGTDLVVAAINNRFSGESPVSLLAITPTGDEINIMDAGTTASARVVHNVSDAPAVDVIVNDAIKLVEGLSFPDFTGYVGVAPDTYNVKVAAAADNSVVVIDADLTLEAGEFYSVLAVGSLGESSIEPLVLVDQPRRIATEARVRIVHGSTLAGPVDIYVTATNNIADATPAFSNVPFKADTGYVALAAGDYVVTVTPTGTKTAAIGPVALSLEANKIYTAIARDGVGLTGDVGLILMDDFVQP